MNVFEVRFHGADGLETQVVTAGDKSEAASVMEEDVAKVIDRGPYLGEGSYRALREEILQTQAR